MACYAFCSLGVGEINNIDVNMNMKQAWLNDKPNKTLPYLQLQEYKTVLIMSADAYTFSCLSKFWVVDKQRPEPLGP